MDAAKSTGTPQVSTVNVTPDESKVRVATVGDVLDMRVVVSDESGLALIVPALR